LYKTITNTFFGDIMKNDAVNNDEQTVFTKKGLQIVLRGTSGNIINELLFSNHFTAGRANDNDIIIPEGDVSRYHLKVTREQGQWWLYNLKSANGVYIQGDLVFDKHRLVFPVSIALGKMGVTLTLRNANQPLRKKPKKLVNDGSVTLFTNKKQPPASAPKQPDLSEAEIGAKLLNPQEPDDMGDHTRIVRRIIRKDQTHRSKGYKKVIISLALLFIIACGLIGYQQFALSNANTLALDMFYDIKTLEVSLSQSEIRLEKNATLFESMLKSIENVQMEAEQLEKIRVEQAKNRAELEKIALERERLKQERKKLTQMKAKYRHYAKQAKSLRLRFPKASRYEEELIARVARDLGESELELPDSFVSEVRKYISYWQGSNRMQRAMLHLQKKGYTKTIVAALKKEGLSLHLFYLPLQESNYNEKAIGPTTRWGIAKGAWQFIPGTARDFGLKTGPLASRREYDSQDERFDFNKAAYAGAKYLKYIFSTESQASGLLVIASYNYGQTRINKNIKKMPNNPRERNFWKYIQRYKLPTETHNYVYYIFSAAVIGQDPKHFGFKFLPPFLPSTDKS